MITRAFALLAVVAAASVAAAQEKKAEAPPVPKPAAEMANLKFFDGSWSCEGKLHPTPMNPAATLKGTVKSSADLGGFWQSGMVKSQASGMPGPFEGMFHMTYDPMGKRYVMLWVDNMGAWAQTSSAGWNGDTIVFEGETYMGGHKMTGRDTFKKNADGSLAHTWEMQMGGAWMPGGEETCRKAAAAK